MGHRGHSGPLERSTFDSMLRFTTNSLVSRPSVAFLVAAITLMASLGCSRDEPSERETSAERSSSAALDFPLPTGWEVAQERTTAPGDQIVTLTSGGHQVVLFLIRQDDRSVARLQYDRITERLRERSDSPLVELSPPGLEGRESRRFHEGDTVIERVYLATDHARVVQVFTTESGRLGDHSIDPSEIDAILRAVVDLP